ncbi:uncharacterized protein JCM6883_004375 [Sporobolomyces salmoneus]|uniref:uncharacterized protein n=1 Tax=Sporobolomyces salmoneus TaxID=183962 RepID=UPI0031724B52
MATVPPVFSPKPSGTSILHPSGAEGGVEAISQRRRNSGSFKHMSSGGLVSNSPFTARLGGLKSPPQSPSKGGGDGQSRIPQPQSLRSAGTTTTTMRKASGDNGPVKENSNPSDLNELAGFGGDSKRNSPLIPFRPIRSSNNPSSSSSSSSASPSIPSTTGSPFKPNRPTFSSSSSPSKRQTPSPSQQQEESDFDRRQSSSYAALRKNGGLVTSSPFTNGQTRSSAAETRSSNSTIPSPEMQQVPYEIAALSHESAPFGYLDLTDEPVEHESTLPVVTSPQQHSAKSGGSELGLGARPGSQWSQHAAAQAHSNDHQQQQQHRRIIASGGYAPSSTPPRQSASSPLTSPNGSALSPLRRGIRGPRPMGYGEDGMVDDDGEETEREGEMKSRTLRRQPSNKTVTWAETEEVLEFEVEEERRRSMMSDVSSSSTTSEDDRRYYRNEDSSDEEEEEEEDYGRRSYPQGQHQQDYSFQEGGSIEVHDVEDSDAEESVVSTTSSAMDDMIEQIDDFIQEESFEGQSRPRDVFGGRQHNNFAQQSNPSNADDLVSEVNSASSYDDDGEEEEDRDVLRNAKQYLLNRSGMQTPASPVRPQLPSPPTPTAQLPPVPSSTAPSHLAPVSSTTSGMPRSESQYSLPDIPGTSPFLGFEEGGAKPSSNSVAITQPLSPRRTPASPPPNHSTPTASTSSSPTRPPMSARTGSSSPILSAFDRLSLNNSNGGGDQSPQLSRKGSLVGSDVTTTSSISWYGSGVNGSLRGGTVRLGRDRLDERMKAHQALLGSTTTSSPTVGTSSFGAFPTLSSPPLPPTASSAQPVGPFSQVMDHTQSAPASSALLSSTGTTPASRAIETRPASKPRSATLSSSMLPTIAASSQRTKLGLSVGAPLTADVAEEMTSPLDRLQRGMEGRVEGTEWKSGDSLLGVADLAKGGKVEREELSSDEDDEAGEHATTMKKAASEPRPRRRRSRSTGDANVAETASAPMEVMHTMPELGFQKKATDAAFASNVLESLDDIYNSRNRTYRVRESKHIVVVSDINGHKAGDVDPGRAWRKKRPSNVHDIKRSASTVSVNSRRAREHSGQLFVCLRDVTFEGVPMPRERVNISASLDNGRQRVEAAVRELVPKVSLKKEFELVCSENLSFSIHFTVPNQPPPPVQAAPAPSPPLSPSKTSRGFRIFSSPKKKATPTRPVAPPPTPDPFYDFVSSDGKLATASINFIDQVSKCRLRKARIVVPFSKKDPHSPRSCGGSLTVDLLFVPAIPGVPKASLAKSMDEVTEGLERADWATKVTHEGVLTQLGGDCSVWRRRNVKLRGNTLVPYSEVTKRSHVEINLSSVATIEDLNAPSVSTPRSRTNSDDMDEDIGRMDNSFRLEFKDGGKIDFFADNGDAKTKWLEVLRQVAGTDAKKGAPEWAVAVRKLPPPNK